MPESKNSAGGGPGSSSTQEPPASASASSSSKPQAPSPAAASAAEAQQPETKASEEAPGEDPNECGWCKWMKGGGCKPEFDVWLKCVDDVRDAGREDVESCASVMGPLWDCMQRNSDYYAMQLDTLKGKSPDGAGGGSGEAAGEGGLAGLAVEVAEDLEEMMEHVLGLGDDE